MLCIISIPSHSTLSQLLFGLNSDKPPTFEMISFCIDIITTTPLSQGPKWKQVKVTDIFVVSIPEHVLMLGNSWFKDNAMKVEFPNKTLTLLDGTSYEVKCN
ncbi:10220_t:CDS:1 [Entrophospora sp. SA101]|nr:10220_t:CDS:1 [Entrophospora sp. SA101]